VTGLVGGVEWSWGGAVACENRGRGVGLAWLGLVWMDLLDTVFSLGWDGIAIRLDGKELGLDVIIILAVVSWNTKPTRAF